MSNIEIQELIENRIKESNDVIRREDCSCNDCKIFYELKSIIDKVKSTPICL